MEEITKQFNLDYSDHYLMENEEQRRIWLNDSVDECVIDDYVYMIFKYNRDDKGVAVSKRKPIVLYINSPGGSVTSGYALVDAIQLSKTPVYTVNMGICYSMGFLIFLAGHKRFAMPHSTFLMHDGSSGVFWESTSKLKDRVEFETDAMEKRTKDYILSRSNLSEKEYEDQYRREWYFYADEGKKHQMVDYIVGADKPLDFIL